MDGKWIFLFGAGLGFGHIVGILYVSVRMFVTRAEFYTHLTKDHGLRRVDQTTWN